MVCEIVQLHFGPLFLMMPSSINSAPIPEACRVLNIIPISSPRTVFFFFNSIDRKLNPPSGKSENSQTECNSLNGTGASYQFAKLFMTFFFHDFLCMFVCHVRAERYAQSTGAFYRNPGAIHDLYHSFNATIYSIIFCS